MIGSFRCGCLNGYRLSETENMCVGKQNDAWSLKNWFWNFFLFLSIWTDVMCRYWRMSRRYWWMWYVLFQLAWRLSLLLRRRFPVAYWSAPVHRWANIGYIQYLSLFIIIKSWRIVHVYNSPIKLVLFHQRFQRMSCSERILFTRVRQYIRFLHLPLPKKYDSSWRQTHLCRCVYTVYSFYVF